MLSYSEYSMVVNSSIFNSDSMYESLKIFKFVVFIILGLLIVDFCIGKSAIWLMERLPDHGGEICEVNYAINRAHPEFLILGSSRANHHYNSRMIADKTHRTVYNAGIDGTNLLYARYVLQRIVKRAVPDIVILELNVGCLFNGNTVDIKHCRLHTGADSMLRDVMQAAGLAQCISINSYRYNSSFLNIVFNVCRPEKGHMILDGFLPLTDTNLYGNSEWEYRKIEGTLQMDTVDELVKILDIAHEYGFELIVTSSPVRYLYNTDNQSSVKIRQLCADAGVTFLDNSQLPFFIQHDEYLRDINHLTGTGANVYTAYFLNQLDSLNIN